MRSYGTFAAHGAVTRMAMPLTALEFFAGSGLVRLGLEPEFATVWANDVCEKKAAVYAANHPGDAMKVKSIADVRADELPHADLAWASFPCQDLSLAGNLSGIRRGTRSGLFWEWLRVIDELIAAGRQPKLLVAENVVGFLVTHESAQFRLAYRALRERGYRVGAIVMDARSFLPQSRPRAFVVAAFQDVPLDQLAQPMPSGSFHPHFLLRAARAVNDPDFVWWSLPEPSGRVQTFADICDRHAPCESAEKTSELRAMLSPHNRRKLEGAIKSGGWLVGTGYRRTRPNERGRKVQRLEVRFDGVAGCLRTPEGGSSRQVVVLVEKKQVLTRLMTVRECARLMGAPDTYELPGTYNDGYRAMGDAVAVPVVRWLTRHLLRPLAARIRNANQKTGESAA